MERPLLSAPNRIRPETRAAYITGQTIYLFQTVMFDRLVYTRIFCGKRFRVPLAAHVANRAKHPSNELLGSSGFRVSGLKHRVCSFRCSRTAPSRIPRKIANPIQERMLWLSNWLAVKPRKYSAERSEISSLSFAAVVMSPDCISRDALNEHTLCGAFYSHPISMCRNHKSPTSLRNPPL